MGISFKWNRAVNQIINDTVLKDGKTIEFMTSEWQRLTDDFVPMNTGNLAHDSVQLLFGLDIGQIHYQADYADANYYGTGRKFNKEKHSLATSKWNEAAKSAGRADFLTVEVGEFIKNGNG